MARERRANPRLAARGAFLTHFGPVTAVAAHLAELMDRLEVMQQLARRLMQTGPVRGGPADRFVEEFRRIFRQQLSDMELRRLNSASPSPCAGRARARAAKT